MEWMRDANSENLKPISIRRNFINYDIITQFNPNHSNKTSPYLYNNDINRPKWPTGYFEEFSVWPLKKGWMIQKNLQDEVSKGDHLLWPVGVWVRTGQTKKNLCRKQMNNFLLGYLPKDETCFLKLTGFPQIKSPDYCFTLGMTWWKIPEIWVRGKNWDNSQSTLCHILKNTIPFSLALTFLSKLDPHRSPLCLKCKWSSATYIHVYGVVQKRLISGYVSPNKSHSYWDANFVKVQVSVQVATNYETRQEYV